MLGVLLRVQYNRRTVQRVPIELSIVHSVHRIVILIAYFTKTDL